MKFFGRVSHQLDEKKRIRIPTKFKNAFPQGEDIYFVQYGEGRISIMSESVMSKRFAWFEDVDPSDTKMMDARTRISSGIELITEDSYGRIALPQSVREYMGVKKDVITVGVGDYIEVWALEKYEQSIGNMPWQSANKAYSTVHEKKTTAKNQTDES